MNKTIILTIVATLACVVIGDIIVNEIVDYMQYQEVLRIKQALIDL